MKSHFVLSVYYKFLALFILLNVSHPSAKAQCKALSLSGTNDYINIPAPFFSYTNAITVEAKINITGTTSVSAPWMGQSSSAINSMNTNVWSWEGSSINNSFIWMVNYGGTVVSVSSTTLSTGWHHIATVSGSTAISIYVDGTLNATASQTIVGSILNNSISVVQIGHDSRYPAGTSGRNGNYLISDFRIWNTERSALDISGNINSCLSPANTLVLYHQFEDGIGKLYATPSTGCYGALINMLPASAWVIGSGSECCNASCSPTVSVNTSGVPGLCPGSITLTASGGGPMNSWVQKTGGFPGRTGAVGFSIGQRGYMASGYSVPGSSAMNDLWEYNPLSNSWSQKANVPGLGRTRAFGFSIGNKGYVGGGQNGGGGEYSDFYEYDPPTNTWLSRASFMGGPRQFLVSFSIGNKGYAGTGGIGQNNDFYEFDPVANAWTQKASFPGSARTGASGFSIGSRGYIGLGWSGGNNFPVDFYEYNPANNTWTQKANFPSTGRWMASDLTIGNNGYIVAGSTGITTNLDDFWEYDPIGNTWTQGPTFSGGVTSEAMAFSIGNRGYIGAGSPNTTNQLWEFSTSFYNYFWSPGINTGSSMLPSGPGPFTLTTLSANGCTSTSSYTANVIAPPVISVGQSSLCLGQTLTISPTGADTYTFNTGPIVSPTVNTNYLITGTSTLSGCSSSVVITLTVRPYPNIFVNSGTVCSGSAFTISPFGALSYTYSSGSNIVSPLTSTFYTIIGSNVFGCVNPTPAISNVSVLPSPVITVNSGTLCQGNTFNLVLGGALTYTIQGGASFVTPLTNSSYTVIGTDALGCVSQSFATANVTVFPLPTISVNSGSICANQSFSIQPSGAAIYSVQGGNWLVSPLTSSSYTVIGISTNGCMSASSAVCQVSVIPNPTITVNSGTICEGSSFTINPGGAISYTVQGGSLIVTPVTSSNYTVMGNNAQGCVSQTTAVCQLTVYPNPTITVNSGTICEGKSFTISPTGANSYTVQGGSFVVFPIASTNYTLIGSNLQGCLSPTSAVCELTVYPSPTVTANSGSICEGNSFNINPSGATSYTVQGGSMIVTPLVGSSSYTLTGSNSFGCVSNTIATATVTVHPLPNVIVTASPSVICVGESSSLIATGAINYTWIPSLPLSGIVSPGSTSNFTLIGEGQSACSKTVNFSLVVDACVSIKESEKSKSNINIYPNPTNELVYVEILNNEIINTGLQINVMNKLGQILYLIPIVQTPSILNLNCLTPGIYFLELEQKGHPPQLRKIIKN